MVHIRHHVQDVTSQYISKRLTEGSAKTFLGQAGYIGIMEKKMETITMGLYRDYNRVYIGVILG